MFDHIVVGAGIVGAWLTRRLLSMGRSVALVEIGHSDPEQPKVAAPALKFPQRENIGAIKARNHVLTGNSRYWGGGLMRNDTQSLCKMFDLKSTSSIPDELTECYRVVERELAVPRACRDRSEANIRMAPIFILPGERRNIARTLLEECINDPKLKMYCDVEIRNVKYGIDNRLEALTLSSPDDSEILIGAKHFVLSMGVVDSNIFALTMLSRTCRKTGHLFGKKLHDHWSIPIAAISWKSGAGLDWLFPPRFSKGFIEAVHAEIEAHYQSGSQTGFLHLQADFDHVEPYATIKKILLGRQKGYQLSKLLRMSVPLAQYFPNLLELAFNRYVRGQLYVPDGMRLNIYLDFESYPSEKNEFIIENGVPKLYWDVRDEDVVTFSRLVAKSNALIRQWVKDRNLQAELLVDGSFEQLEQYLRENVVDAYHLGGGLAIGSTVDRGVINRDYRFHEIENLAVIGTATFLNAGIANPVETLLAMCERYSRTLT